MADGNSCVGGGGGPKCVSTVGSGRVGREGFVVDGVCGMLIEIGRERALGWMVWRRDLSLFQIATRNGCRNLVYVYVGKDSGRSEEKTLGRDFFVAANGAQSVSESA